MTARAKGASGWLSAKSRWRSIVSACRRPGRLDVARRSTTPEVSSSLASTSACRCRRRWSLTSWWLSESSRAAWATGLPSRARMLTSIECETRSRGWSGSGSATMSRSNVSSDQLTKPSGAFLRWIFFCFLGSSPAFSTARRFSTTWSGACATTQPRASKPARPARPTIWWNSRALSRRCFVPSNFVRPVSSTVRIGTLMPTPSVSVPQMTLSRPSCASCSTRRRYFGSMPAWCTPMPCRTSRESVRPKPGPEAEAADALGDRLALLARRDLDGHEALGALEGGRLREVDDVDRCAVLLEQLLDGLVEGRHGIRELEGDGALGAGDDGGGAAGAPGQVVREHRDVAERGRHEDELRLRQLDDRHLPRPAAVGLGVEVELVHDDETRRRPSCPLAERGSRGSRRCSR